MFGVRWAGEVVVVAAMMRERKGGLGIGLKEGMEKCGGMTVCGRIVGRETVLFLFYLFIFIYAFFCNITF